MKDFSDRDIILAFAKRFGIDVAHYEGVSMMSEGTKKKGGTSTISLTLNGESLVDFHLDDCQECVKVSGEQLEDDESLH